MNFEQLRSSLTGREIGLIGGARPCALLVPIVENNGELCLLYEVRAKGLSLQPGEVCFPGGKMEPGEDARSCSLREIREELGIPADKIDVLGEMDYTIHSAGFPIYPVLARLSADWEEIMQVNEAEVEEVFTIPLSYLRYNPPRKARIERVYHLLDDIPQSDMVISDRRAKLETQETLFWPYEGKLLWGMSAQVTDWLLDWTDALK